jgi:hypothetical protein
LGVRVGDGDEDLRHITGHPDDSDLLCAAMGTASLMPKAPYDPPRHHGGMARSRDGGSTWQGLEAD